MTIGNFYLVTLSFFFGVLFCTLFFVSLPTIVWLVFLGLIFLLLWKRSILKSEIRITLTVGLLLLAFSLGALRVDIANQKFGHSDLEKVVGTQVELIGTVIKSPDVRANSTNLEVDTGDDILLVSTDRYTDVQYGDEISLAGEITRPESFETEFGRVFDYPGYLKAKGIEYRVSFAEVKVLSAGNGNLFVSTLLNFKQSFMSRIESEITEPASGLGEGLLLGVKQALGEELEEAFRATGIIHIVVLSGYNIMLVVMFVMYILSHLLKRRPRAVVGVLAIVSFALLVGLSATVVRASVMATLLIVMQTTGRKYLVLRALMVAGLIMLLINPYLLVYDVGFQLSFLATLGLILISPHLEVWLQRVPALFGVRSFLVATLSAQIAVMPVLLYQIGQFSVVAVLVNVLVLPMVPVAMLLTFITGLTSYVFPVLASVVAFPTFLSLTYISSMALWFAKLPFAAFVVPVFSFTIVPLAYGIIGYILWRLHDSSVVYGYGDIGGEVLQKNLAHKTEVKVTDFSDWEIVEEFDKEIPTIKKAAEQSPTASSKSDTPIFFR